MSLFKQCWKQGVPTEKGYGWLSIPKHSCHEQGRERSALEPNRATRKIKDLTTPSLDWKINKTNCARMREGWRKERERWGSEPERDQDEQGQWIWPFWEVSPFPGKNQQFSSWAKINNRQFGISPTVNYKTIVETVAGIIVCISCLLYARN